MADSIDGLLDERAQEAKKRRGELNLDGTAEEVELTPENLEELRKVGYFD